MVADATDIKIFMPYDSEDTTATTAIAHLTNATINLQAITRPIMRKGEGMHSRSVVMKFAWDISGTSYVEYYPGHSFNTLAKLHVTRAELPVKFKMLGEEYTGNVIITDLRGSGSTAQNVSMSFSLSGQGELNIPTITTT